MSEFFDTTAMYEPVNYTIITLLPKVSNPQTIKKYRPIAYCTVLYKLISKIFTTRLKGVMPSIISDTQVGFIPGRRISDNIFLAHELVKGYTRKTYHQEVRTS